MAKSESTKPTKRRLRAPSQTVRERAEEAQQTADKPASPKRTRRVASKVTKPLHKPARKVAKAFHRQPFIFIGRIVWPRYFRDAYHELRLVVWPDRRQSRRLTGAVLAFAVVFGAAIAIVDYGLDKVFKSILLK